MILATPAAQIIVATPATLPAVIAAAHPGDTIKLTPGATYPPMYLRGAQARSFVPAITIDATSAIIQGWRLDGFSGVHIIGGAFNPIAPVLDGLAISHGSDWSITGWSCSGAVRGCIVAGYVSGLKVLHGNVIGAGSDGIDIAESDNVEVAFNICSGGKPTAGAHADCGQFYSLDPARPLRKIYIHHNVAKGPTQGFDFFSPGQPMAYDINVSFNTAIVAASRGISVNPSGGISGCTVIGNKVGLDPASKNIVQMDWAAGCTTSANSGNSARPTMTVQAAK